MAFSGTPILKIAPASPASRAGLRPGDQVLLCNNSQVTDWVDLLAQSSASTISLSIRRGSLQRTINLNRRPGIQWGIELKGSSVRGCRNKCVFCFIDQQPPGLRASLLLKDDDVRYSFLEGTYITLTSQQADEAITRRFSSLHVSVHTTNSALRGKMLGLPGPLEILPQIDRLAENGIEIQAQIVEVPGWNDGRELEKTISDLYKRCNVTILGIVPVGLTKWRDGLPSLLTPDRKQAEQTVKTVKMWQEKAQTEKGHPWVYLADEYYAITDETIPPVSFYKDNSLAANGIGLLAGMINECAEKAFSGKGMILTGLMAAPYIEEILAATDYHVVPVENTIMGSQVTVAGLLCGEDVINAVLLHNTRNVTVFLPSAMFNHNGVTLDEYTTASISEKTGVKVKIVSLDSIGELP